MTAPIFFTLSFEKYFIEKNKILIYNGFIKRTGIERRM